MKKVQYKPLVYPVKIVVAWAEAIGGNNKIRDWLGKNGYPELYTFVYALKLKDEAKEWLMKNNYPHLVALIDGAEGNETARSWLLRNKFSILWHMALAADGDVESTNWLLKYERDFAMVALKIQMVKMDIETDNSDPHKISAE